MGGGLGFYVFTLVLQSQKTRVPSANICTHGLGAAAVTEEGGVGVGGGGG